MSEPFTVTLTHEEAELIWTALRYSDSHHSPEAKARHAEAMTILAAELRKGQPTEGDPHMSFVYDNSITENSIRIDVTVVDTDSDVMLTLKSGRLGIPVFLTITNAMELARLLTNAVCAYDDAVAKA